MADEPTWATFSVEGNEHLDAGDEMRLEIVGDDGVQRGFVPVQSVAAADIADLVSNQADLKRVHSHVSRLLSGQVPADLAEPLWEAAVIAYGRCFAKGTGAMKGRPRRPIPDEVMEALPESALVTSRNLVLTRNKHVGHRQNSAFQAIVGAVTENEDNTGPVIGVGWFAIYQSVPDDALRPTLRLCELLLTGIEQVLAREQAELLEQLQADDAWRPGPR